MGRGVGGGGSREADCASVFGEQAPQVRRHRHARIARPQVHVAADAATAAPAAEL